MIATGKIIKVDDSKDEQKITVEFSKDEFLECRRFQQYGVTSNPPRGSTVLGASGGNRASFIGFAEENDNRPKGTSEGDVTVYNGKSTVKLEGDKVLVNGTDVLQIINDLVEVIETICHKEVKNGFPIYLPLESIPGLSKIKEALNAK